MSLARADGVGVVLDGRVVLDGLSVRVEAGDRITVTGRSGSGKTTLLLVLAGLLAPTTGRLELGLPERQVLYVPQAPSLVPELSALDNASLALRVRGVVPAQARERAADELRLLGLGDTLEALPAELSGGQQQRVALARATAVRPVLLLADEPTGSLDRATGSRVLDALLALGDSCGTALMLATHDGRVAAHLGGGATELHLADGRLQELPV